MIINNRMDCVNLAYDHIVKTSQNIINIIHITRVNIYKLYNKLSSKCNYSLNKKQYITILYMLFAHYDKLYKSYNKFIDGTIRHKTINIGQSDDITSIIVYIHNIVKRYCHRVRYASSLRNLLFVLYDTNKMLVREHYVNKFYLHYFIFALDDYHDRMLKNNGVKENSAEEIFHDLFES